MYIKTWGTRYERRCRRFAMAALLLVYSVVTSAGVVALVYGAEPWKVVVPWLVMTTLYLEKPGVWLRW